MRVLLRQGQRGPLALRLVWWAEVPVLLPQGPFALRLVGRNTSPPSAGPVRPAPGGQKYQSSFHPEKED
eukprot:1278555-Alexandrium_andersonii.AAC.1